MAREGANDYTFTTFPPQPELTFPLAVQLEATFYSTLGRLPTHVIFRRRPATSEAAYARGGV